MPRSLPCKHLTLLCNRFLKLRLRSGRRSTERSAACDSLWQYSRAQLKAQGAGFAQESLLAKCRALTAEGLTARHWAGGYAYPPPTITGSAQRDVCLIESCIGVGEIAVSDHRGSVPSAAELARLARRATGASRAGKQGGSSIRTLVGLLHGLPCQCWACARRLGVKDLARHAVATSDACANGDCIALLPVRVHNQGRAACYERASSAVCGSQADTHLPLNTE